MPKGADLHIHLTGAVYAEDAAQGAADAGAWLCRSTLEVAAPPASAADNATCAGGWQPLAEALAASNGTDVLQGLVEAWSLQDYSGSDPYWCGGVLPRGARSGRGSGAGGALAGPSPCAGRHAQPDVRPLLAGPCPTRYFFSLFGVFDYAMKLQVGVGGPGGACARRLPLPRSLSCHRCPSPAEAAHRQAAGAAGPPGKRAGASRRRQAGGAGGAARRRRTQRGRALGGVACAHTACPCLALPFFRSTLSSSATWPRAPRWTPPTRAPGTRCCWRRRSGGTARRRRWAGCARSSQVGGMRADSPMLAPPPQRMMCGPPPAPQELLGRLHAELTARDDWEAGVDATVADHDDLLSELEESDALVRLQAYA